MMRWLLRGVLVLMALSTLRAVPATAPAVDRPPLPDGGSLVIPVAGASMAALHSNFNEWRGNHRHCALDILAPRGTPVLAAADGRVQKLFTSKAGGLTIYEFDPSETTVYYYAHLDHYADDLREGMTLHRGEVIGFVGTTGNAPKNTPHLHFAIGKLPPSKKWWKGVPIDPYPILRDHGVTVAPDQVTAAAGR